MEVLLQSVLLHSRTWSLWLKGCTCRRPKSSRGHSCQDLPCTPCLPLALAIQKHQHEQHYLSISLVTLFQKTYKNCPVCAYCIQETALKVEGMQANLRLNKTARLCVPITESVTTHILRSEDNIFSRLSLFEGCIPTKQNQTTIEIQTATSS